LGNNSQRFPLRPKALSLTCGFLLKQALMKRLNFMLIWMTIVSMLGLQITAIAQRTTEIYILRNKNKLEAAFMTYGARLVRLSVPDKNKQSTAVVVGFISAHDYEKSTEPYFGATIGRYANRIALGKFKLNGKDYQIPINNGPNALHGGKDGFQNKTWNARQLGDTSIEFTYLSKDGEEGFPGNLRVRVIYTLTIGNELKCEYEATTDRTTVLNLTNHAFFNLNGESGHSILSQLLQINAEKYTPVDSTLIPTGEIIPVMGTVFDFTKMHSIGQDINRPDLQLKYGNGYDHNYVLNGSGMKWAATVIADRSGIIMEIYTTEPGLQFYSGNAMQGKNKLREGMDDFRTAFCLETQHFPDSPNQPGFPSTVLKPGEIYHSLTLYRFSTQQINDNGNRN
jgi:aldose 1-epimerase